MNTSHTQADTVDVVERTPFGYLTASHPGLDRFQNAISAVCGIIAGLAIVVMTLLITVGVVTRTVFGAPLGWSIGFIDTYLLTAAAFFGIVTAYRGGAHIAVVTLFNRLPGPTQKWLLMLSYVVLITGLGYLFWAGLQGTLFAIETKQGPVPGSTELLTPDWVMYVIVPISMGLGIIVVGIDLLLELLSPWNAATTNYHTGGEVDESVAAAAPLTDATSDTDAPSKTKANQIADG